MMTPINQLIHNFITISSIKWAHCLLESDAQAQPTALRLSVTFDDRMTSFRADAGLLNQMTMQTSLGKPLSLSSAAWFLALYHDSEDWDVSTRDAFATAIAQHSDAFFDNLGTSKSFSLKKDPRLDQILASRKISDTLKLFTDYDPLKEALDESPMRGVQRVATSDDADFVFACNHFRNFLELPVNQRVCQFPYEGCVVRKDLLPITVRKHCYNENGKDPVWWQPCYDLATEFHLFAYDYQQRLAAKKQSGDVEINNRWIIKPAQGTRGKGHQLIVSQDEAGLQQAACCAPRVLKSQLPVPLLSYSNKNFNDYAEDTGDRIVQLLVEHPLLMDNRKFDIRCFVFVRSFEPFVAFAPILHYARLANKPYSMDGLDDYQVALTVTCYDDDESIANLQERRFHTEFHACLAAQYGVGVIDTVGMWEKTLSLLRDLFGTAAAREIGQWPNSSAYYSVDVIYDASELVASSSSSSSAENTAIHQDQSKNFVPQPKLIEVNFKGDWHGVELAVGDQKDLYHEWVQDMLQVMVLTEQVSIEELEANPRLHRL